MTDTRSDGEALQGTLALSEEPMTMTASGIRRSQHGEICDPLPGSMEDFLLDRYRQALEDPLTGRRIR